MKFIRLFLARFFAAVVSLVLVLLASSSALWAGVASDPSIVTPPSDLTITNKGTIELSVAASGSAPLKYQWFKNNAAMAKATNATYVKTNALTTDAGAYSVRVTNLVGSITSSAVIVTVDLPVAVTKHPVNVAKTLGQIQTAKFAVTATGNNLKYQWRKNDEAILGATAGVYVVPMVTNAPASPDLYSVIVSNVSFAVTSSVATLTALADAKIPSVVVTTPKALGSYNDSVVTAYQMGIGGKAGDDAQITNVLFSINGSSFEPLTFNINGPAATWTNPAVTVEPGTNVLQVYAVDYSGLPSAVKKVTFFYDVRSGFDLYTNNLPDSSGIMNLVRPVLSKALWTNDGSADLLVGRGYRLNAVNTSTNNYIFTNWTFTSSTNGLMVLETNDLTLDYVMRSNMVIYANFITNPFVMHGGNYYGLFSETDGLKQESAGYISLAVSRILGVSGKLLVDGNTVGFSGKFALDGTFTGTGKRVGFEKPDLTVKLKMNFGENTVTGTVASVNWTSAVVADRYVWSKDNPAVNYTNTYTMVLPGFANNASGPAGFGGGTATVNTNGMVVLSGGALADKHPLKQTTWLSSQGDWPVFVPLYSTSRILPISGKTINEHRGFVMGWLAFQTNSTITNLAPKGALTWINTSTSSPQWPNGFTNSVAVMASRYVNRNPLFNWTNGLAEVSGANLSSPFAANIILTNKLISPLPLAQNFKGTLTPRNGLVTGTFDGTMPKTAWLGVLLQDYGLGYGFFTNSGGSGDVILRPANCGSKLPPYLAAGSSILFNGTPVVGNTVSAAPGYVPFTFDASAFSDPSSCVGNGLLTWQWNLSLGGTPITTGLSGENTSTLVLATNSLTTGVYTIGLTVTGSSGLTTNLSLTLTVDPNTPIALSLKTIVRQSQNNERTVTNSIALYSPTETVAFAISLDAFKTFLEVNAVGDFNENYTYDWRVDVIGGDFDYTNVGMTGYLTNTLTLSRNSLPDTFDIVFHVTVTRRIGGLQTEFIVNSQIVNSQLDLDMATTCQGAATACPTCPCRFSVALPTTEAH